MTSVCQGFSGGASGKELTCQCWKHEIGVQSQAGRSPGGGHGNPLQYSCPKNPIDSRAWLVTVPGVAKSHT